MRNLLSFSLSSAETSLIAEIKRAKPGESETEARGGRWDFIPSRRAPRTAKFPISPFSRRFSIDGAYAKDRVSFPELLFVVVIKKRSTVLFTCTPALQRKREYKFKLKNKSAFAFSMLTRTKKQAQLALTIISIAHAYMLKVLCHRDFAHFFVKTVII